MSGGNDLPTGTVTLLFTDIEGSTALLERLGDAYGDVLAMHHRVLRDAWTKHRGVEVETEGDAFFVAFEAPPMRWPPPRRARRRWLLRMGWMGWCAGWRCFQKRRFARKAALFDRPFDSATRLRRQRH